MEQIALLERLADSLATAIAHRQGAEQLRASEERYRLLADNADDFVLVNHVDGRRLYISPSFYRVTGWRRSCIRPFRAILDAAQRSAGIARQLLAFARRDVIQPRVLDLNETVEPC